jgi:hypothetical protein
VSIVPLTIIVSLSLAFTFVVFFLGEHARGRLGGAERDSLLPLAEETPRRADDGPRRCGDEVARGVSADSR